jgi:hypothetical protein
MLIYIKEEHLRNAQEITKDWLRRIKILKVENLTVYFLLMKALLARKTQFKKQNSNFGV